MGRSFGYALCAGVAGLLAVIYTLLQVDWDPAQGAPEASAHAPESPGGGAGAVDRSQGPDDRTR
jgi:hypothetical protein